MPTPCRTHGMSSATFCRWRAKFCDMDASLIARLKELEEENRRIKKLDVEAQLSADLLREALEKTWEASAASRAGPRGSPNGARDHSTRVSLSPSAKRATAIRVHRSGAGGGHSLAQDLQQRTTEHGTGRHHALNQTCACSIAPRLAPVRNGGITEIAAGNPRTRIRVRSTRR
jgi:putative transposase